MTKTVKVWENDGDNDHNYEINISLPPGRRGREYVVIHTPWLGPDHVDSYHASMVAAERAARKASKQFHRNDSLSGTSFGHYWRPGRIID